MTIESLDLKSRVDQILEQRRLALPQVETERKAVATRAADIETLIRLLDELDQVESDAPAKEILKDVSGDLRKLSDVLKARLDDLETMKKRFSRETVNIGVSGEARVGKSTTLQSFSGLTDTQIPTGDGLPVTAVRSEIFNSHDEEAEITFRNPESFVTEFVQPNLEILNKSLGDHPFQVSTLSEFRSIKFPENLGDNNVDAITSDSLNQLRDAQKSLETFETLLTGEVKRIPLGELRQYVAYPTNDEINAESNGGSAATRNYLAVHSVKIYCPFPNLDGVKIGLVDLPGLGEIGDRVAETHLSGLDDGIDQIFPIMRPTESEGFLKKSISDNIDHLRRIQPGIKRRSDLITAGMNVYENLKGHESAKSLRDDFERKVNGAQKSDKIDILEYNAADGESVALAFNQLLEKIADRLPRMDREVLEYTIRSKEDEDYVASAMQSLDQAMNKLLRSIPLADRMLNDKIDQVTKNLVDDYNKYEVQLSTDVGTPSALYQKFDEEVEKIFNSVVKELDAGFFLGEKGWLASAKGHPDYYNWYRDECQRLRREIIANYSRLDVFYDDRVAELKNNAVDIFLKHTGSLEDRFKFNAADGPGTRIDKMSSELSATVKDDDLDEALSLLKSVQFNFRNNVFLQIAKHLDSLANPVENFGRNENIREVLGGLGPIEQKVDRLSEYLKSVSTVANENIRKALVNHDDRFHEYLFVSMSFFIDYLYRKDYENFKHTVIRAIINEYRDLVFANEGEVEIDSQKKRLIDRIKELSSSISDGRSSDESSESSSVKPVEQKKVSKKSDGVYRKAAKQPQVNSSLDGSAKKPDGDSGFVSNIKLGPPR